jgi:hypothetical protein
MNFLMAINRNDKGYSVSCTNLNPYGKDEAQEVLAIKNIETAIKQYLQSTGDEEKTNDEIKLIKVEVTL